MAGNVASMSARMSSGDVCGAYRLTVRPSGATRNLVKFHLIASMMKPPALSFRKEKTGWVPEPLTSTFVERAKSTP